MNSSFKLLAALCAVVFLSLANAASAESESVMYRYFFGKVSVSKVGCQPNEASVEEPTPVEDVTQVEEPTPVEDATPVEEVSGQPAEESVQATEETGQVPEETAEEAYEKLSEDAELIPKRFGQTFFPLELTSDRDSYRYVSDDERDTVTLKVKTGKKAFLYVWSLNPQGEFRLIYPSKFNSDSSQYEAVDADKEITIPGPESEYEFAVAPPFGEEMIIAIARIRPFDPKNEEDQKAMAPFLTECKKQLPGAKAIKTFHKSVVDSVKIHPAEFGFKAIHIKTVKAETLSE